MELRVLGIILAGGKGTRLWPLTKERAKPAVPFAGKYRIVDFVLSNFINSGIYSIYVLTQFRSQSLLQHLSEGWQMGGILKNQFIIPVPAQMRSPGEQWYQGTADAIHQNINLVEQADPHIVAIFGADHIYRMNIAHMIADHRRTGASCTVAAIPVARKYAGEFGVIETSPDNRILDFHEKNPDSPSIPGDPARVFASMGNYLFSTYTLLKALNEDAADLNSSHDFGRDILPRLVVDHHAVYAYDYRTNQIPGEPLDSEPYWRDVGTIEAYWEANMDLRAVKPALNLYNRQWPLRTNNYSDPPAKFTFDEENRRGEAIDSIVSGGCILSGGRVRNSILGRGVRVHAGALVEDSVILDNCDIGRRAKIRRAILDKNVRVPPDSTIGYDPALERKIYHDCYHATESGIVIVEGNRTPVDISSLSI
jgi:glucose-1-phosphate adenylyltransferase